MDGGGNCLENVLHQKRTTRRRSQHLNRMIRPAELARMPKPWPPEVDCDEIAMFMASLLLASGVPCELVTIADNPADPTRFTHVYVQAVLDDGSKLPLDVFCDKPGDEFPLRFHRKEWGVMQPPKSAMRKRKLSETNNFTAGQPSRDPHSGEGEKWNSY